MTLDQAKAIVNEYRSRAAKSNPAEFMRYWRARAVLAKAGIETLTAGQRGFVAAATGGVVPQEESE